MHTRFVRWSPLGYLEVSRDSDVLFADINSNRGQQRQARSRSERGQAKPDRRRSRESGSNGPRPGQGVSNFGPQRSPEPDCEDPKPSPAVSQNNESHKGE